MALQLEPLVQNQLLLWSKAFMGPHFGDESFIDHMELHVLYYFA